MAAGDITLVNESGFKPQAPLAIDTVDVEGQASYTTGGLKLDLNDPLAIPLLRGRLIRSVIVNAAFGNSNAKFGQYDAANDKLVFLDGNFAEISATTDLTGEVLRLTVISE